MNGKSSQRKWKGCLSKIKAQDVAAIGPMIAALLVTPFYKRHLKDTWAVCERPREAHDNGYHFFKYVTQNHPEQKIIYFIENNSKEIERVRSLGEAAQFGSFFHWLAYFSCPYLISSQSFRPNGNLCAALERSGLFRTKQVFLQHGITINKPDYLKADKRPLLFFTTGSLPETQFVSEAFGYPEGTVRYTGFARFDALHDGTTPIKGRVFVMPTWRKWLSDRTSQTNEELLQSEFFTRWYSLLTGQAFLDVVEKNDLEVLFYPHPNMRSLLDVKQFESTSVHVVEENADIQMYIKTSEALITDYSSVFFDAVYLKRPIIFYQFDESLFRNRHYGEGWFNYHHSSFGTWCDREEAVITALNDLASRSFSVSEYFMREYKETFPLNDDKNCERIYDLLAGRLLERTASSFE